MWSITALCGLSSGGDPPNDVYCAHLRPQTYRRPRGCAFLEKDQICCWGPAGPVAGFVSSSAAKQHLATPAAEVVLWYPRRLDEIRQDFCLFFSFVCCFFFLRKCHCINIQYKLSRFLVCLCVCACASALKKTSPRFISLPYILCRTSLSFYPSLTHPTIRHYKIQTTCSFEQHPK